MFETRFFGSDMEPEEGDRRVGMRNMGMRGKQSRSVGKMIENGRGFGIGVYMMLGERNELEPDGKYTSSQEQRRSLPVSYTHLTLPTILLV